jgi:hypothetical protein
LLSHRSGGIMNRPAFGYQRLGVTKLLALWWA